MARPTRVEWNGHAVDQVGAGAADGLQDWAELLLDASQVEVPVETGALRDSGTVSVERAELVAAVSYDGVEAPVQHEMLNYHHPNGGKAKFLEQPLHATKGEGLAALAARIRRVTR